MKKPKLPKAIRVGAYVFKIVKCEPGVSDDEDADGQFRANQEHICVSREVSRTRELEVLIHETNHAVYFTYNIQGEDDEERTVHTLSTAWTQIYRDNPDLIRYIQEVVQ